MSQKVTAVNCIMKSIGRKDAKEAFAKFKFQLTSAIVKGFEWPDITGASEWEPEAPNDQFRCHWIEITPNSPELREHTLHLDAATISDFQIQTKAKKEGKNAVKAQKRKVDVLCTVRFTAVDALAHLEAFKVNANKNSEMTIDYDPAPRQGDLEGTRVDVVSGEVHATPEQRQAVLEMPMDEGNKPTHADRVKQKREEAKRFAELRERAKGGKPAK